MHHMIGGACNLQVLEILREDVEKELLDATQANLHLFATQVWGSPKPLQYCR